MSINILIITGIIGYCGENNWVLGGNNWSVLRAVRNRIMGEFLSILASPLLPFMLFVI